MQASLDAPVLQLPQDFNDHQNTYLTPAKKLTLIKKWCKNQNINIKLFKRYFKRHAHHMHKKKIHFILVVNQIAEKHMQLDRSKKLNVFTGRLTREQHLIHLCGSTLYIYVAGLH